MELKTTTREVKDYHFSLNHEEMGALLADPIAWADNLRAELNWQAPLAETPAKPRHARQATKRKPKVPKAPGRKPAAKGTLKCSTCGKVFTAQGWLNKHQATEHPTPAATPTTESSPA